MKKCPMCGGKKFEIVHEEIPTVGLPSVILVGIKKSICKNCGEDWTEIPHHNELMDVITVALLNKKRLLAPAEIRWLRSHLGFTTAQLAEYMMVSPTSVSYWENGHRKASSTTDLALRLLVLLTLPKGSFSPEGVPQINMQSNSPLRLRLRFKDSHWQIEEGGSTPANKELLITDLIQPTWGVWPAQRDSAEG